jgi:predicted DsbA family dithiol-disulfide isomerase
VITIDVVHDIICPWCRLGEAYLDKALSAWAGEPVEVRLHAFQLAPEVAPEGVNQREHLIKKFGGNSARLDAAHARLTEMGRGAGLTFHFDKVERLPNTLKAHAMISAVPLDKQRPLLHAMQKAYFEDGLDVGSTQVLADLGVSVGLSPDEAYRVASEADPAAAQEDVRDMIELGITGVPTFIVNRRYQIVGAQQPETILQALQRVSAEGQASRTV